MLVFDIEFSEINIIVYCFLLLLLVAVASVFEILRAMWSDPSTIDSSFLYCWYCVEYFFLQ